MNNKLIKCGKWALSCLYALYLIIIIVNVAFQSTDITNGMIEAYGTFGYVMTYALNFLMASGFFMGSTLIQLIVYHVKEKSVSKSLAPLIIFEVIKIIGTSIYIFLIDYANVQRGGAVTAFIVLGMIVFAVIAVLEIVLMILMKKNENQGEIL